MPPELAAGPGGKAMGKASLRDPAAVQLQQRALRCLEARSGDARHLLSGEAHGRPFVSALRRTARGAASWGRPAEPALCALECVVAP